jgi:fructose-bisphosphate aldolase class II
MTAAVREALAAKPEEFDPRHFTRASRNGMKRVVAQRMREFGQAGHADDYDPVSLRAMRLRYTTDAVDARAGAVA